MWKTEGKSKGEDWERGKVGGIDSLLPSITDTHGHDDTSCSWLSNEKTIDVLLGIIDYNDYSDYGLYSAVYRMSIACGICKFITLYITTWIRNPRLAIFQSRLSMASILRQVVIHLISVLKPKRYRMKRYWYSCPSWYHVRVSACPKKEGLSMSSSLHLDVHLNKRPYIHLGNDWDIFGTILLNKGLDTGDGTTQDQRYRVLVSIHQQ